MAAAKNVKLMQIWSSGYDKFNIEVAHTLGIPVANNGGANASSVAEHAVMLMFAVARKLPDSYRRVIEGNWAGNDHGLSMYMLEGKRLGIIGFGNIGRQVAQKVSGLGMDVSYYDINPAPDDVEKLLNVQYRPLDEILSGSDIISVHMHLSNMTRGLIGKNEIANMKDGVTLINVSRADILDRDALIDAMKQRKVLGLGVDVYSKEPTARGDELFDFPGFVGTHHVAGSNRDVYLTVLARAKENISRVINGEQPLWLIK
jgi:D-3-phosphoglycerate dehydrogenase